MRWAIMTRIAFFPSRCDAKYMDLLSSVADYAEHCLRLRYGPVLDHDVHRYLSIHWNDITKHVGPRRRHILGVYSGSRHSVMYTETARKAAQEVALRQAHGERQDV